MTTKRLDDALILDLLASLANSANAGLAGPTMFGDLCTRLLGLGVPVWRAAIQLENLHPLYYGYCLHWYEGEVVREIARSFEFASSPAFAASPYKASLRSGFYRRQIATEGPDPAVPLTAKLAREGVTDFLADLLSPSDNTMPPGVTWATRTPDGFTDAQVAFLRALLPHLGPIFGLSAERRKLDAVLRTYLGQGPSRAVAQGRVRRGELVPIEAAVLLTDLRGFSAKTAALPLDALMGLLSRYFEAVAEAVAAEGGDILKFIGDGVLAVFPASAPGDFGAPCRAALAAARQICARLRDDDGGAPLDVTAAIHAGSLAFGNVGAKDRLDFTVIGPAVNVVSRLEGKAKEIGEPVLLSREVARRLAGEARFVDRCELRGLPGTFELYAPA